MQSRLVAFAFVALLVASVRAVTPADGCEDEAGDAGFYANHTAVCAQEIACTTSFVSCLGSQHDCAKTVMCVAERFACLNVAAENTTGCPQLADVHLSLLEVAGGNILYVDSNAEKSCRASACNWVNKTHGSSCELDYGKLCKSPISCIATFVFGGNFSEIMADATLRQEIADAISADFATFSGIDGTFTRRLFNPSGNFNTLVAELETPGVACSFSVMAEKLRAAGLNSDWLTRTNAVYGRVHPGKSMTVKKVGAGGADSAFSSYEDSESDSTATATSGVATRSILAAIALAVMWPLLF